MLGRHRSTIYRELKRNHVHDPQFKQYSGHYPLTANDLCLRRRHVRRKLVRYPGLRHCREHQPAHPAALHRPDADRRLAPQPALSRSEYHPAQMPRLPNTRRSL
ncbi:hypothetical protein [Phyllobacterium zundukense]|uniref:hypothetical protein n=1 Tax=Phyllobacterium zundukense TaxID=1867719 RepID=UPI0039659FAA